MSEQQSKTEMEKANTAATTTVQVQEGRQVVIGISGVVYDRYTLQPV